MIDAALAQLDSLANPEKAAQIAAYHKVDRRYLGITLPQIDELTSAWRAEATLEQRLNLAAALWDSASHEGRIAASKLLLQARIRPDEGAWDLICQWVPQFDAWAIADHVSIAGQKRLVADPSRIATLDAWTRSPHMWTRRAAMVMTLPWAKMNFPKAADLAIREQVLGWAESYADDPEWFMQKCVAWWLRDHSKHDAPRVRRWLDDHGARLKPFARKEAGKYLR